MYVLQHSCCEELRIVGVYDNMEAATLQCRVMSYNDTDGERFYITHHEVESTEEVQSRFDRVKLHRNYHNS